MPRSCAGEWSVHNAHSARQNHAFLERPWGNIVVRGSEDKALIGLGPTPWLGHSHGWDHLRGAAPSRAPRSLREQAFAVHEADSQVLQGRKVEADHRDLEDMAVELVRV